jgi:protein-tyrosine phosphatase
MEPVLRRVRAELRTLTRTYPVLTLHVAIGAVFSILAVAFAIVTGALGGLTWVLAWPAVSLGLISLGYLWLGPGVVGKRSDGTLAWYAALIHLPYLTAAELAWWLVRVLGREDPWHEVAKGYFLGRRVQHWELPARVALVLDLTAEFVEPVEVRTGRKYVCVPALDASAPSPERLADGVAAAVGCTGNVYVHCAAGHGRSAMALAVLLVARGIVRDVDEAIAAMQAARVTVSLRTTQRRVAEQAVAILRARGVAPPRERSTADRV